jgi:hypothetical protein
MLESFGDRLGPARGPRPGRVRAEQRRRDATLEARVKRECADLYPGVDPGVWYVVVEEGEYEDDLQGLWLQVGDWVTYVLARHFDVQARSAMH